MLERLAEEERRKDLEIELQRRAEISQPASQDIANISLSEFDHFSAKFKAEKYYEEYLKSEPFVASLEYLKPDGSKELLLICRGYTPLRLNPKTPNAMFASYLAPKGSFASGMPGMTMYWGGPCVLIWKSTFTPTRTDLTDALIATQGKLSQLNSMRAFDVYHEFEIAKTNKIINGPQPSPVSANAGPIQPPASPTSSTAPDSTSLSPQLKAGTREEPDKLTGPSEPSTKMTPVFPLSNNYPSFIPPASPHRQSNERGVALPMKAILDPVQDAIFRSPLNTRIRISGGPGTGKTTVLLKRLSQKNKFEFLTAEEKLLFQGGRGWREQDWYLFSPSDLLKGYLEKALAKELLPAGDEHVKVYGTFRNEILRDLGILRVGKHGSLTFAGDDDSAVFQWTPSIDRNYVVAFAKYLQGYYARMIKHHVTATSSEIRRLSEILRAHTSPITFEAIDWELEIIARGLDAAIPAEPPRAREFVQRIRRVSDCANSAYGILTRSSAIANVVKAHCDKLLAITKLRPFEAMFDKVAESYVEFRDGFAEPAKRGRRSVCAAELDLLLFAILDNIHQLWDVIGDESIRVPVKIKSLAGQLRVNICIDEVTDFSPLEIACMEKFAVPRIGGVTICGDLMQRVTSRGISDWRELDIFSKGLAGHELGIAYRQTGRLFAIAKDLFLAKTDFDGADFKSAYPTQETDPPALAVCLGSMELVAAWVSERIFEIFDLCGQHLPTVAVLVPDCDSIETIASRLRVLLVPAGIEVDASPSGALLGNPSRIRVFPVTAIKGLEFEAVFYVDLDIMAKLQPDLIDKYVYVGLSRARSFLGVTYRETFPRELEEIVDHFQERECFSIDGKAPHGDDHPLRLADGGSPA